MEKFKIDYNFFNTIHEVFNTVCCLLRKNGVGDINGGCLSIFSTEDSGLIGIFPIGISPLPKWGKVLKEVEKILRTLFAATDEIASGDCSTNFNIKKGRPGGIKGAECIWIFESDALPEINESIACAIAIALEPGMRTDNGQSVARMKRIFSIIYEQVGNRNPLVRKVIEKIVRVNAHAGEYFGDLIPPPVTQQ